MLKAQQRKAAEAPSQQELETSSPVPEFKYDSDEFDSDGNEKTLLSRLGRKVVKVQSVVSILVTETAAQKEEVRAKVT